MKILGYILGAIILIPVAVVIAALLSISLIGGWLTAVVALLWRVLLIVALVFVIVKVIKMFTK